MIERSVLLSVIGSVLEPMGFRKRRANFFRMLPEVYSVLQLQASEWDASWYVNVGLTPAEQVSGGWLPEAKCGVRFRLEAVRAVSIDALSLLGPEATPDDPDWERSVREKIVAPLASILESAVDIAGLQRSLQSDLSPRVFVHRDLRSLLQAMES